MFKALKNTQNLSTLKVFQLLSRKCKSHFLQSYPKGFIQFLCECIVNLLKRNLQTKKKHHVVKFEDKVWLLSLSKLRQILHSKASYSKFTLTTRKFKRKRAFARFKKEIWCMDLAYVDKLSKKNNGVKYLPVRQDLFDRTVNAKGMKTNDSQETVKAFSSMITKRNRTEEIWVDKGTEFAWALKTFCAAEGIQVYSTMSETKAVFAERTKRSLKNILYRYMEDFGYKYIHTLPQFITTLNCRRNSSINMRQNTVKYCGFMSILYSKTFTRI